MSNRRFEMFELRNILVRMRQGDSDRSLARAGLIGRDKARELRQLAAEAGWLDPALPLPDNAQLGQVLMPPTPAAQRPASCVEPYRSQVEAWVAQGIQSSTIYQALQRNHQFRGSYSSVYRFVRQLAPPSVKATVQLEFAPGEAAQVDFGSGPMLRDTRTGQPVKTWFFLMTLAFSRHQYSELVLNQTVATWLECHRRAFEFFGGVVQRLIIDNPKCAITKACYHDPVVQRAYAEYAEGYGFKIDACPPRQPQKKGRVEAGIKYLKRGFVPTREFVDLADANRQLQQWILTEAGQRCHGTTGEQPLRLFAAEQALLQPLPAIAPELAVWAKVKVHRDAHVQFDKCLYSVPFRLMGQTLWLKASPYLIRLYQDQQLLVVHQRAFRAGTRRTVDDHLPPEALAYRLHNPTWCRAEAERIGTACQRLIEDLFSDRVLHNLRAAQGILALEKKYGAQRLEAACQRALDFHNPRYRTVKSILQKGLDAQPCPQQAFDTLAECYTGQGKFGRDLTQLLKH